MADAKTICLLSLSPTADDPRVRRQGDAFSRAGWNVVAIGLGGAKSKLPNWKIVSVDEPMQRKNEDVENGAGFAGCRSSAKFQFERLLRRVLRAGKLLAVRTAPALASRIYWSYFPTVGDVYEAAKGINADVWLANDWIMLPIAERLTRERGGVYGYDTHELATDEYEESLTWRFWHRPFVRAIEMQSIRGAAVISAVSSGIAARLRCMYDLGHAPLVIRNVPPLESYPLRPTGSQIRILYHGLVASGRGLEQLIRSARGWQPNAELTIRGPGPADYISKLQDCSRQFKVEDRIKFSSPVPASELVRRAAEFDVGVVALPAHSRHNKYALPNKFFEYIMAGLALCVSDLPEMAKLVRNYNLGVLFGNLDFGEHCVIDQ